MFYEERHGFNVKTVLMLLGGAVLAACMIVWPPDSVVLSAAGLTLFIGGGLLGLVNALSRKVALRVDRSGITIGGAPVRYQTSTRRIPWADAESVVLWKQHSSGSSVSWIGVLRRADAPPLNTARRGALSQRMSSMTATLGGVPDPRLLQCAAAVLGWKIDTAQLAATLKKVAPDVRLIDHR
ncbi:hypothetical protein AB0H76_09370 [Nocardia sp. NPDC050712]|uniref:hypothetical protein n=1 Tax=Nocardia sp. NPDC050712 TaxID=3155518 RepID=UPI0033C9E519